MRKFLLSRRKSFQFAFSGMSYVLRTQKNVWIHLFITILVFIAGIILVFSLYEWMILFLCIAFVWITEFINTAIEAAVDLVATEVHPLAKISKDVAAAAVLIASISAVIVGFLLFGPKVLMLLV